MFVANALSPAQVISVDIDEEHRIASVTVPERMLSLAIGREGQNARLAARLTGWRIDIRSDVSVAEAKAAADAGRDRPVGRGARQPTRPSGAAADAAAAVEDAPKPKRVTKKARRSRGNDATPPTPSRRRSRGDRRRGRRPTAKPKRATEGGAPRRPPLEPDVTATDGVAADAVRRHQPPSPSVPRRRPPPSPPGRWRRRPGSEGRRPAARPDSNLRRLSDGPPEA